MSAFPKTKVWLSRTEQIRRVGVNAAMLKFLHLNASSGLEAENVRLQAEDAARVLESDLNVINYDLDIQSELWKIYKDMKTMYQSAIVMLKGEGYDDSHDDKEDRIVTIRAEYPYTSSQEL